MQCNFTFPLLYEYVVLVGLLPLGYFGNDFLNLYFCCVSEMTDRHLIKSHICKCWEPVIYVAIEVDLRKWKRREDLLQLSDNFSFLWPLISLCSPAINRYRLCTRTNIVTSFSTYIAIFSSRRPTSICPYV